MKIDKRKIFIITILAVCIISINLAVFLQITEKPEEDETYEIIDTTLLTEDFYNIFDNKVDYQQNSINLQKIDVSKDIVYTSYYDEKKLENTYDISVAIPNFNINTEEAQRINQEINKLFYDKATNIATVDTTTTSFCYLYFELKPICELALDSKVSALEYGAKYNCKVDPNKEKYTFYLIDNNEDETIDLIMSHNINALGEAVIPGLSSDLGMVLWYANNWDNSYGPTTAMTYLYNATKNWKNIEPLNFTYYDKEVQISDYGYESFISKNGIAKITSVNGTSVTIGSEAIPLRSRLPVYTAYSTNAEFNEIIDLKTNTFLNDNLDKERKNGPSGYWTISSRTFYSNMCWAVGTSTFVYDAVTSYDNYYGVRPVITVRL